MASEPASTDRRRGDFISSILRNRIARLSNTEEQLH